MVYICFILLIACGGEFYYFNKLIEDKKKHIFTLTRENSLLKSRVHTLNKKENISITFSYISNNLGEVSNKASMYLSPLASSPCLCTFQTTQKVKVLCKGDVNNEIWYEIEIDGSSRINTRGWVKASSITFLEHSLLNI